MSLFVSGSKYLKNSDNYFICWLQYGSHLWALALQKRKEGRCPLEPGKITVMLREIGYPKDTQIYVAFGQVYGGQNSMAPLRNIFPYLARCGALIFCRLCVLLDTETVYRKLSTTLQMEPD